VVAMLCRFDEIALHRSLRWVTGQVPLTSMSAIWATTFKN
jgi:hypothetical protein